MIAGHHLWKGLSLQFTEDVDDSSLGQWAHRGLLVLGATGFVSRSLMLAIAGSLFAVAARQYDPQESGGIDQALQTIADAPFGRGLLLAASLGLAAAGAYDALTFRRHRLE